MKIKSDAEYRECKRGIDKIIQTGTTRGSMDLLDQSDKDELIRLSDMVEEWEAAYHPLPGKVSTLITDEIRRKMDEANLNQIEAAEKLGVSKSRISELLSGKRALNLNLVKRLRDNFGIPADFILDNM
jgi:HTH-type transcriptional regulator/antitoxin HigA